ncbi:hypothetical protein DENSPDRAFT_411773 [Dentipellis sp. KUC8613]|nr:hypothetical protein DENSPDRAFT_411773 [Dentipellis sp. KUC8613]
MARRHCAGYVMPPLSCTPTFVTIEMSRGQLGIVEALGTRHLLPPRLYEHSISVSRSREPPRGCTFQLLAYGGSIAGGTHRSKSLSASGE